MRIGEAAFESGCHLETIRYYERIGLLPKAARHGNGYRTYSEVDVSRLRFIARGRELGFSLDEVRTLLELAERRDLSCTEVDRLARQQLAQVRTRIRELQRIARELERTIKSCTQESCGNCAILNALQRPVRASITRRARSAPQHLRALADTAVNHTHDRGET